MDKKLQDLAWSVLPKEFKKEVKKSYLYYSRMAKDQYDCGIVDTIETIFGKHNLTSDAEGEEMLMVDKRKVQDVYKTSHEIVSNEVYGSKMYSMHLQILCVLEALFGSKCLPDVPSSDAHEDNFATKEPKPAEPKFKAGDIVLYRGNKCRITDCFTEPHYYLTYADGKYRGQFLGLNRESDLELYTESEEVINEDNFTKLEPVIGDKKPKYKIGDTLSNYYCSDIPVITEVLNTPWGYIYCLDNQTDRIYEKVI